MTQFVPTIFFTVTSCDIRSIGERLAKAWSESDKDLVIGTEDIRAFYRIVPVRAGAPAHAGPRFTSSSVC